MSGREGDGVHDGAQLTDSIMVLSIDQASKDVAMISLPRDLKPKLVLLLKKSMNFTFVLTQEAIMNLLVRTP